MFQTTNQQFGCISMFFHQCRIAPNSSRLATFPDLDENQDRKSVMEKNPAGNLP